MGTTDHLEKKVGDWILHHYPEADSTNDLAKKLPAWSAIRADIQTGGRGRHGRSWSSGKGGLWLSLVIPTPGKRERWEILPLTVGWVILETLKEIGISNARIRWPNDIMIGDKKLAAFSSSVLTMKRLSSVSVSMSPINLRMRMILLWDRLSFLSSSTRGATWKQHDLLLPIDSNWRPLQLMFSSPTSGWMVLQRETSQAFDSGVLMKTSDGGLTWQSFDLPSAAPIDFVSEKEAWMTNRDGDKLFRTTDGGVTWKPQPLNQHTISQPPTPEGTTRSGWMANGLGWATTSTNRCTGLKSTPSFSCQIVTGLLQSLDGGKTWQEISLPTQIPIKR